MSRKQSNYKLTNTESIGLWVALFKGIVSPFPLEKAQS